MTLRNNLSSLLVIALLLAAGVWTLSTSNVTAAPARNDGPQSGESVVLTGRIVNLQRFLADKEYPNGGHDGDSELMNLELNPQIPVGLWVEEKLLLGDIVITRPIYLIVHDSNIFDQQEVYDQARDMVGNSVRVEGKYFYRNGMRSVQIEKIHSTSLAGAM